MSTPNPVGYHCDHSDEPSGQRTHHNWEFVEDEGFVFTHQPDTISAHGGTQDYLKPEQRDRRCPRAVPVYAVDVPALLADIDRLRGEHEADRRTWQSDLTKLREARAERDELKQRLHDAAMTRTWANEDGKKFVFVEDIAPHLLGSTKGGDAR